MRPIARGATIAGVPVLIAEPLHAAAPYRTVLWFHGFRADALAHAGELERCAAMGFLAVGIDAVGHGARLAPDLSARVVSDGALPVMFDLADRTIDELPALVGELAAERGADGARVSVVGVSMGAFLVYRAIARGLPIRAAAALLGSPEWSGANSPHLAIESFGTVALLSVTAEHDENVPPEAARRLHMALDLRFSAAQHRYVELPGSGHLTPPPSWEHAMRETMNWLQRFG